MNSYTSNNSHLLIVNRGEELIERLNQYASESDLNSAWLSGLGGADQVTLGFYDLEAKDYVWQEYSQPLEIVSLTGNMTIVDGRPYWHIHGVFSGQDFQSISGHVNSLRVGLTAEVLITPLPMNLTRSFDETTGLKLIDDLNAN